MNMLFYLNLESQESRESKEKLAEQRDGDPDTVDAIGKIESLNRDIRV